MALKSERHETVVNPNEGIYVEMEQIMEVGLEFGGVHVHCRLSNYLSLKCETW